MVLTTRRETRTDMSGFITTIGKRVTRTNRIRIQYKKTTTDMYLPTSSVQSKKLRQDIVPVDPIFPTIVYNLNFKSISLSE